MSKREFMEELRELLWELPEQEREDALQYYESYFEEAGEENEPQVLSELGSAGRVAVQILRDVREEQRAASYERGTQPPDPASAAETESLPIRYRGETEGNDGSDRNGGGAHEGERSGETAWSSQGQTEGQSGGKGIYITKRKRSGTEWVLLLVLLVLTCPMWIGLLGGAFGLLVGAAAFVFGIGVAAVALMFSGVAVLFFGAVRLLTVPIVGVVCLAIALVLFGVGCLLLALCIGAAKLVAWLFRSGVRLLGGIFHGRRAAEA